MRPISVRALARPHEGIVLDDLVLLPPPLQLNAYASAWQQVQRQCPELTHDLDFAATVTNEHDTAPAYRISYGIFRQRAINQELWTHASWHRLPLSVRSDISCCRWTQEATLIVQYFPNSGMRYAILEDGLVNEVICNLGLFRLSKIKQLGYLTDPVVHYLSGSTARGETLTHSRYEHSLDVMAIATCIAHNCEIQGTELNALRFAALTHDILTPAGGDATKRVSPAELDEDANFRKVFQQSDFAALQRRYALDPELIFATIQNEGLLGRILDIADKLAYVSRDLASYLVHVEPSQSDRELLPNEYEQITAYARHIPDLCSVWESFTRIDNQLVCTDPERLADFLYVRLLLFRQFYANPATRFHEATTIKLILEHMYQTGTVTIDRLLSMGDGQLEDEMAGLLGLHPYELCAAAGVGTPAFCTVATQAAAHAYCQQLARDGLYPVLYEHLQPFLKRSSNKFLVTTPNGTIGLLSDMYPALEAQLLAVEQLDQPWAVYWLTDFNPRTSELFRSLVEQNIEQRFGIRRSH